MSQQLFQNAFQQYRLGNLSEASQLCNRLLEQQPTHAQGLCLQGMIARRAGQSATAVQFITSALEKEPTNPHFWNNLGLAMEDLGHRHEALNVYKQGLAFQQSHAELLSNLANILVGQGQFEVAEAYFLSGLKAAPASPELQTNFANFLAARGKREEAITHYQKALQADPDYWLAHFNLGNVYFQQGHSEQAIAHYEQTIRLHPQFEKTYFFLAQAHKQAGRPEMELVSYRRLAEFNPKSVFAHSRMAIWYESKGFMPEAAELYQKVASLQPNQSIWPVRLAGLFPALASSADEILQSREQLAHALTQAQASQQAFDLKQAFEGRCQPSGFMAYHGLNDQPLKSQYADWLIDKLGIEVHGIAAKPMIDRTVKIGFLVTENHERVFKRVMGGYIQHLDRQKFQIQIICPESRVLGIQSLFPEITDLTFITLPSEIEGCVSTLKKTALDILFFFEVGTDVKNYLLSLYRFAPVQCTSWGYPTTSGSPNMDYYISSALIETEGAAAQYRENLVLLENLPTYYSKPLLPETYKSRAELNLPEHKTLYICPQTLLKFHPDFDAILLQILKKDLNGEIILVEGLYPSWTEALENRFDISMPQWRHRIRLLPALNYENYLSLLKTADVILDTPYFGGGITTYEALAVGTPIVTLPGASLRDRYTLACYRKIDILDCVAESPEHYAQLAVAIASEPSYRQSIQERILAKNQVLFEDMSVVREMEACLINMVEKATTPAVR